MKIAILTGPTATGKTALAIRFATNWNARHPGQGMEIINADSMLVYRGLDIGTAKPSTEERASIPHHLIDIRDANEPYTAGDFRRDVEELLARLSTEGKRALIVGGTGFYLKALTHGLWEAPKAPPEMRAALEKEETLPLWNRLDALDPAAAQKIGPADRYRIIRALEIIETSGRKVSELESTHVPQPIAPYRLFWTDRNDDELQPRILTRTREMLSQGVVEETRRAIHQWGDGIRPLGAVGYREVVRFLQGVAPEGRKLRPGLAGLEDEIALATRQLVKSQRTWFRGIEGAQRFLLDEQGPELEQSLFDAYS